MENIRLAQQIIKDAPSIVGIRREEPKEDKNIQIPILTTPTQPALHQNLEQQKSIPGASQQQHMRPEQNIGIYLSSVFIFIAFYSILIFYCFKRKNNTNKKPKIAAIEKVTMKQGEVNISKMSRDSSQNNSTSHSLNGENSLSTDEDQPFLEKIAKPYITSSMNRTKTHPSSQNPQINFPKMQSNQDGIFAYGIKRHQNKEEHVRVSIGYMKNFNGNLFPTAKSPQIILNGSNIPVRQTISV